MKKSAINFDFNNSIIEIEKIVNELESGDLSLEQSLENYEKGIALIKQCKKTLLNAEQKISKLSKEDDYQKEQDL